MSDIFEEIQVAISPDKMEAYVSLNFVKGEFVTLSQIEGKLRDKGVVHGVLKDVLLDAINRSLFSQSILAAKATPPAKGADAHYEDKVILKRKPTPKELEDGRVDHYELGVISKVDKDMLLAVKTPVQYGTDGTTVTGEKIPAKKGEDVPLPAGEGTYISKDGMNLLAERAGHAFIENDLICVKPVLLITGDVGFSTGNIDFPGKVIISGSIKTKFKVQAQDDIIISGDVEGAEIRSSAGNVIIEGGVKGQKKGIIEAYLQLTARFAEYATLISKTQGISVQETLFHTTAEAAQGIYVNRGKGTILGGKISAGKEVCAKFIGTKSFIFTEICVATAEQKSKLREAHERENELAQMVKELTKSKTNPRMASNVPALEKKVTLLKERISALKQAFNQTLDNKVSVMDVIYPGVSMEIVGEMFEVNQEYRGVAFVKTDVSQPLKVEKIAP